MKKLFFIAVSIGFLGWVAGSVFAYVALENSYMNRSGYASSNGSGYSRHLTGYSDFLARLNSKKVSHSGYQKSSGYLSSPAHAITSRRRGV